MPPAVIGAITGAGALLGGSAIQARSVGKAADKESDTADKALAHAKEIYEQQRSDQAPYRQTGYGSLNALN